MIKKVLIANRGEIACRIIRTLDTLGIDSVAVYSEADRDAMHVRMATESVCIGPAAAAQSYLDSDRIIGATKKCNADAVHPGYGFLSENPAFVRALQKAGIVFIGPDAESIEAMGLKDAAKASMEAAGVPVVPGYHEDNQDPQLLAAKAQDIGYPVLIKARAGGGGKGMRKVEQAADFTAALDSAKRESLAAFGDDNVLIEKFVSSPRHIEIQVFGDRHGNVVHLYERDCSLQRRHQKVIEEAPAPGMTEAMRQAMGQAAVAAARAVNYVGAGTVEFIVDASDGLRADRFYFMEMNTRLQVEHPVTECITGTDLVAWQIAVANGQPLPLAQQDIPLNGHAFEARIYAEDADNDFLPATGTLSYLQFPVDARIDTGVRQGDAVSPFYDPMIAKLIVCGSSRQQALRQLKRALAATRIGGSTTNVGFLGRLCDAEQFVEGNATTALIEESRASLSRPDDVPEAAFATAALVRAGLLGVQSVSGSPWQALRGFRQWGDSVTAVDGTIGTREFTASVVFGDNHHVVNLADSRIEVSNSSPSLLIFNGISREIDWFSQASTVTVYVDGESWLFHFRDPLISVADDSAGNNNILAPMPGSIISVTVKAGEQVSQGDTLVQMEAMKMEHTLVAERDGVVAEVNVHEGDQVAAGALLLQLEEST